MPIHADKLRAKGYVPSRGNDAKLRTCIRSLDKMIEKHPWHRSDDEKLNIRIRDLSGFERWMVPELTRIYEEQGWSFYEDAGSFYVERLESKRARESSELTAGIFVYSIMFGFAILLALAAHKTLSAIANLFG